MEQKKEFWIAFGINFFFPGGGHIYAGDSNKGIGLLITYIIAWALTPELIVPAIIVIGVWIYALVKTREVIDTYNHDIDAKKEDQAKEELNSITAEQFVTSINKINQLFVSEMFTEAEFKAKKQALISELQFKKLKSDHDDMLLGLAPLKKNGIISDEELKDIKKILSTIS